MRGPSPSTEHQCQKQKFPTTFGCENQQRLCPGDIEGCWKPRCALTGPVHIQVYSLTDTHPKLQ